MKSESGFTLIELLVVVIIIGVLSAIALPNFLRQASKAKESEAMVVANTFIKSQQVHRIEHGEFATGLSELGMSNDSSNYKFQADTTASNSRLIATPTKNDYRAVVGMVGVSENNNNLVSGICRAKKAGKEGSNLATLSVGENDIFCGKDWSKL